MKPLRELLNKNIVQNKLNKITIVEMTCNLKNEQLYIIKTDITKNKEKYLDTAVRSIIVTSDEYKYRCIILNELLIIDDEDFMQEIKKIWLKDKRSSLRRINMDVLFLFVTQILITKEITQKVGLTEEEVLELMYAIIENWDGIAIVSDKNSAEYHFSGIDKKSLIFRSRESYTLELYRLTKTKEEIIEYEKLHKMQQHIVNLAQYINMTIK